MPPHWYGVLAALKFAGVLGLLAGIFWRPIGIAAAVGVVLYLSRSPLCGVPGARSAGDGYSGNGRSSMTCFMTRVEVRRWTPGSLASCWS
ncbi:DoxX family protein [Streptomyces sp. NPDC058228]|uniref:DoxX family protein n=1 Tax=Streptomyces sp. NPDC058228 TaxID=3346390 RepID=UPI0036F15E64